MPEFVHRGIKLKYMDRGRGRPFFFIHGLGGGIAQVRLAVDAVEGVRLIAPEMQGHGGSWVRWEDYGFSSLADDVIALADHLGIPSFCLGGISMGAAVSLNLALRFPDRVQGLALVRPAWTDGPMKPEVRDLFELLARYLKRRDEEGFLATPEYAHLKAISAYAAEAFSGNFRNEVSLRNYRKFILLPAQAPFDDLGMLQGIAMPVDVIACKNDLMHPFEYGEILARHIPGARLFEIPDKDADPQGHRDALNVRLQACLKERLGA